MQINKKELIKKLELTKPGISEKGMIEFTDSFSFTGTELVTYNDEISIRCDLETDFKGTINGTTFYKAISKTAPDKDGDIELSVENEEMRISGKQEKAGIVFEEKGKLPVDEIKYGDKWNKLPTDFFKGLKLSAFCASRDASTPLLTCVFVNKDRVISTDQDRIFSYTLDKKIKDNFLIPASYINTLSNYDIKTYNINDEWVNFKTQDNVLVSCRIYHGAEYPDLQEFIETDWGGTDYKFPKNMEETIEKAALFCEQLIKEDEHITIENKKKKTIIKAQNNTGWFKKALPNKTAPDFSFEINIHFLRDILKSIDICTIHQGDKNFLIFNAENWKHLIIVDEV